MTILQQIPKQTKTFNKKSFLKNSKAIICEEEVTNKFNSLLRKLESEKNSILCMRGDSKKTLEEHNDFIKNLDSIFIVGNKSKSHLNIETIEENSATKSLSDRENLIEILKNKVIEINSIIDSYPSNYKITGCLNEDIFSSFQKMTIEELYKWKIFLLYIIHNSGKNTKFNKGTPVISVTHGNKKYEIASNFSITRNNHKKGFIYIYVLDVDSKYYLKTEVLNQELKKYGVKWHRDIHNEIMLTNGMFPHFLLGIYETSSEGIENLFINPWLYEQFKTNEEFDVTKGLKIDQKNFSSLAEERGYKQFFVKYNGCETTFVTDKNYELHQELIETRI